MIKSFRDKETEKIFRGKFSKRFARDLQKKTLQRMRRLDAADGPEDLRVPTSNRLEALSGDRKGYHSIRVNEQFRLVFRFDGGDVQDVELTDYH